MLMKLRPNSGRTWTAYITCKHSHKRVRKSSLDSSDSWRCVFFMLKMVTMTSSHIRWSATCIDDRWWDVDGDFAVLSKTLLENWADWSFRVGSPSAIPRILFIHRIFHLFIICNPILSCLFRIHTKNDKRKHERDEKMMDKKTIKQKLHVERSRCEDGCRQTWRLK